MHFEKEKTYLVIGDRKYKPALLKIKTRNAEAQIKIMEKNDLLNLLSFSYSEEKDPIAFLLKKGKYDYSQIKKILNILHVGNFQNHPVFSGIYEELKAEGCLEFDEYAKVELARYREILLFESDEDEELKGILERSGYAYKLVHFTDFGFLGRYLENQPTILTFENKFKQYLYIFSDIRRRLQENPELQQNITIFVKDMSDIFYTASFQKIFNIPTRTVYKVPFFSDELVHQNLVAFQKNRNMKMVTEIPEASPAKKLSDIISHYQLDCLSFDFGYASLMEILSSQSMNITYENKGIQMTNEISFLDDIVYVTCFQHDDFYSECDDNNIVSDAELERMQVNTSYVKTRMDRRLKLNFIQQHEIALLSRVELHLQDKIYDSQFLKENNWTATKSKDDDLSGIFTEKAQNLVVGDYLDENDGKPQKGYRDYDHRYTATQATYDPTLYSVSMLKQYYECPFYFYLEKILRVSAKDMHPDLSAARMGKLAHKVFENIYTNKGFITDFDKTYEDVFSKAVDEYRENGKIKNADGTETTQYIELTAEDKANIEYMRYWLRDIVKAQQDIFLMQTVNIYKEKAEQKIQFTLKDEETQEEFPFVGYIDKLIYSQGPEKEKFVTLVDYKTGHSGDFKIQEVFLGGSLQLPLYAHGLQEPGNDHLMEEATFAGFGIQHIYLYSVPLNEKTKEYTTRDLQGKTAIGSGGGVFIQALDYLRSIDPSTIAQNKDGAIKFGKGTFLSLPLHYDDTAQNPVLPIFNGVDYGVESMYEDAKNSAIKNIRRIRKADFPIRPTASSDGSSQCDYCSYKDICYRAKTDMREIKKEVDAHFHSVDNKTEEE